jgi:hypothetical protein
MVTPGTSLCVFVAKTDDVAGIFVGAQKRSSLD